ncbi:hypothetical protein EOA27_31325 [Mesorhizobium sp. M2A.F.Ca.ET.037.01.1.1]|nr:MULTISPECIES: hypothetical protein [unclassified Mesorhizobium]RUY10104.1 hypothetical protein EOA25_09545 [Mesorhizobium sp. M2A.F.Ca.ET.040.01.1.1]RUX03210.1 hypothetical protein EOA27_31325 [Mesorhizobium sp. M2A.F.Ca.ET.037.01.1.1]RWA93622.1 MAG: hypothetical protein EOQ31_00550 [Mesorhizobium sp.]RWX65494.1 hypothetical protein EOA24_20515 [Mesorhizobium sp. M2A.F.Ca.ET.039.01.1.1]TIV18839.1 MAG: hypothetical protein E5V95_11630 [Mesorhizobium sp.]
MVKSNLERARLPWVPVGLFIGVWALERGKGTPPDATRLDSSLARQLINQPDIQADVPLATA